MAEASTWDYNGMHHIGHVHIHYRHIGDQCIHPDDHMHKIGEVT